MKKNSIPNQEIRTRLVTNLRQQRGKVISIMQLITFFPTL